MKHEDLREGMRVTLRKDATNDGYPGMVGSMCRMHGETFTVRLMFDNENGKCFHVAENGWAWGAQWFDPEQLPMEPL